MYFEGGSRETRLHRATVVLLVVVPRDERRRWGAPDAGADLAERRYDLRRRGVQMLADRVQFTVELLLGG